MICISLNKKYVKVMKWVC